MDVFPVINDVVAITHSDGLRTTALIQLLGYFIALPLLLIYPIFWAINYFLLNLRSVFAQKNFYFSVYERHLPSGSGVRYKIPNYPVLYFGDIGPKSKLEIFLFIFRPLSWPTVFLEGVLPWYKGRLLGGKLPPNANQLQGIKVSIYFFLPYVYLTFYQKESPSDDEAVWIKQKIRLSNKKETEVLFNTLYKIRLKWG